MNIKEIKYWLKNKNVNKGFSIIEMLIAVSVFSLFAGGFLLSYLHGQQSNVFAGQRSRATYLADEGLEVVRNIRNESYANLINGTHGLNITNGHWVFFRDHDMIDDFFTRSINITQIDQFRKRITSTVTWQQTPFTQGKVELVTYLTNWLR